MAAKTVEGVRNWGSNKRGIDGNNSLVSSLCGFRDRSSAGSKGRDPGQRVRGSAMKLAGQKLHYSWYFVSCSVT